jgi:4-methyl-5(b-hydroxyethyl)-thiazole monophosphate biosynthesis
VSVASVADVQVTGSRGVKLKADKTLSECVNNVYDLIVLPGGAEGSKKLRDCADLVQMLKKQKQENRLYGAICAAPVVVLQTYGLLEGRKATCHPTLAKGLIVRDKADCRVVVDENCITSQAPGTAIEFALKLVELLYSRSKAEEIARSMCVTQF